VGSVFPWDETDPEIGPRAAASDDQELGLGDWGSGDHEANGLDVPSLRRPPP